MSNFGTQNSNVFTRFEVRKNVFVGFVCKFVYLCVFLCHLSVLCNILTVIYFFVISGKILLGSLIITIYLK